MSDQLTIVPSIPYAVTAPPRRTPGVWAGIVMLLSGVCLVGFGGCFLIGVMMVVEGPNFNKGKTPLGPGESNLVTMLYVCATVSFVSGLFMLGLGVRTLMRALQSRAG